VTRWIDDPIGAADSLIESVLDEVQLTRDCRVLIANQHGRLLGQLRARGVSAEVWNRRIARDGDGATPWPPLRAYDVILLRLPKSKPEQEMTIHVLAPRLVAGGRLIVYGGNDEGIKPLAQRLTNVFQVVVTRAARGHGRIVEARDLIDRAALKSPGAAWAVTRDIALSGGVRCWQSYPGLFAGGTLDDGTALCLDHLPTLDVGAKVLDYGCGTGVLAAAILKVEPTACLTLLDNDTLALTAAQENTGASDTVLGVSLGACGPRTFDLIISNPPLHVGVREDHTAINQLMADAPGRLHKDGVLQMVVQRRVMLQRPLAERFNQVESIAEDARYRIWRASHPKR
jgi:16S rRNA (guanine1207-N2)-methyltransferase